MFYALGYHRAHGVALLVALAALSSPVLAQWSMNDSYRLDQIYLQLGGDYNSSHSIYSDLTAILSLQRQLVNGSSDTYDLLDSFFDEFRHVLTPDSDAINVDFNLDGYYPYVHEGISYDPTVHAELLVTNRAETFWLEKIYNRLGIVCNTNYWYLLGSGASSPYGYVTAGNWDFKTRQNDYLHDLELLMTGEIDHRTFLTRWADYRMTGFDFFRSFDYNNMTSEDKTAFENGYRFYFGSAPAGAIRNYLKLFSNEGNLRQKYYGTKVFRDYFENSGLSSDKFSSTNFFTADGSIENTDNAFTNTETSVFSKFATSFLPSGMFDPDAVNTDLFEYVDSDISQSPSFNPPNLSGNGGLRSSSSDPFDYDFDDSSGDYDYNLINPLETATDKVQHDTDLDNKFERLAGLVNERITSIFQNPLNSISSQPSRWQASLIDKDMNETEDYVDPQYSKSSDGVQFVCWCCESMMFFTFFSYCVRRSLNVQKTREVSSDI